MLTLARAQSGHSDQLEGYGHASRGSGPCCTAFGKLVRAHCGCIVHIQAGHVCSVDCAVAFASQKKQRTSSAIPDIALYIFFKCITLEGILCRTNLSIRIPMSAHSTLLLPESSKLRKSIRGYPKVRQVGVNLMQSLLSCRARDAQPHLAGVRAQ